MQSEGSFCVLEDVGAVDDAQIGIHAQTQAFEERGEVPGIDPLPVDRGLLADGVEAGAIKEGLGQRMAGEGLIEPGGGGPERGREHHRVGRGSP